MSTTVTAGDITIHRIVEQEGAFIPIVEFLPDMTPEVLEENRAWLEPSALEPVTANIIVCIQSYVIRTPHHTILIDSCIGNDKDPLIDLAGIEKQTRPTCGRYKTLAFRSMQSTWSCAPTCTPTMSAGTPDSLMDVGCRRSRTRATFFLKPNWPTGQSGTRRSLSRQWKTACCQYC